MVACFLNWILLYRFLIAMKTKKKKNKKKKIKWIECLLSASWFCSTPSLLCVYCITGFRLERSSSSSSSRCNNNIIALHRQLFSFYQSRFLCRVQARIEFSSYIYHGFTLASFSPSFNSFHPSDEGGGLVMVAIRQTSLPAQHVNDEIQSLHLPASVQEAITSFPRPPGQR